VSRELPGYDAWVTRDRPEPTACECGNGLHYEIDRECGVCGDCRAELDRESDADAECAAEAARNEAALATLTRTLLDVTSRIAARSRRATKHVELALDCDADAALFVGATTEAPRAAL